MDDQQRAQVGAQVRRARKSRGWNMKELAAEAGVAEGTVVSVENGRRVRPGNLKAVVDALGLVVAPAERTVNDKAELAADIVRKWMEALPVEEQDDALNDLIRHTLLRKG